MTKQLFEFTDNELQERFADLWSLAEFFRDGLLAQMKDDGVPNNVKINIDRRKIYLVIESSYQDIARYKNYHQDDPFNTRLDATKRGAFMIKWIARFKPLEPYTEGLIEPDEDSEYIEVLQTINEDFALSVAEAHMSEELEMDLAFSTSKRIELAYDLLFREMTRDAWIAILKIAQDCAPHIEHSPFLVKISD